MTDELLPLSFDPVSNGEFLPPPKSARDREAERRIHRIAEKHAARTGVTRRSFLAGSCGIAATLSTINEVYGSGGGRYAITPEMLLDPAAASTVVDGKEFIFDIQSHHVMPEGDWREKSPGMAAILRLMEGGRRKQKDNLLGISRYFYTKEMYLDSDTSVAVLSALPALPEGQPLPSKDAVETREIVDRLGKSKRLLIHGLVTPNVDPVEGQLDGMEKLASEFKISAWKTYTPWGPKGTGWWLNDEKLGLPLVEKARALGIKVICTHKGFPLPFLPAKRHELPIDVGPVAKLFPDVSFIIYHSGFDPNVVEGPYDPAKAERGVNCLIKSLEDHGIKPNSNVYAELGSTWWVLMRKPEQAAHVLGKLLKHVGEDRVVWGTDSIWYGSPQPQIEAFRAFEISEELREKHGYPALTKELKAKIFGLNAAVPYKVDPKALRQELPRDEVEKLKQAYLENPQRTYATYGPRTRREFLQLLRSHEGCPA
ncbi:MAG TPA: amidohydrolase family protein [Planctomycetota bacterium]|nr:amidohydrolase family protein [Planctomycetota bacterium]